jgi:UDP-N-acetylglucosamine--N-acetylmuramyl-(pentapeptide) pyrophosphoryl-undecaprenol N-acetylglucosamine transferase
MRVSLAAAGTAGHIEPALALAHWLQSSDPSIRCEFIGTSAGLDSALMESQGFVRYPITKAPFPRRLSLRSLLWPIKFSQSLIQISRALQGSELVVGFGGYVCAPTYIVAKLKNLPILIHEANVKPGMANNLGRRLGARLTVAFESTCSVHQQWSSATVVGMPLRANVRTLAVSTPQERALLRVKKSHDWGFDPKRPIALVFGGSQGSRRINDVIAQLLPESSAAGIQIVHAVGGANSLPARSDSYLPLHYISDMPEAMIACDFAITRGGAVTCAELGALRTYAVVVPLSIGNGEQVFNAQELTAQGGATVIAEKEFSSRLLSQHFISYVKAAQEYKTSTSAPLFPLDAEARLGEIAKELLGERS